MNFAKMDGRLRLERRRPDAKDDLGAPKEVWDLVADVPVERVELSAGTRLSNGQIVAEASTLFRTRWLPKLDDVTPRDRAIHKGRTYAITSAPPPGRRAVLEIVAASRTDLKP